MWGRIYLIPLLQAEEDRDLVRKHYADLAREKELMGKETSAYNSDKYVRILYYSILGQRSGGCERTGGKSLCAQSRCLRLRRGREENGIPDQHRTELTNLPYRFVRPTFAVAPANITK